MVDPAVGAAELERALSENRGQADLPAVDRALTGVDRQMRTLVEQLSHVPVGSTMADVVLQKLASRQEQPKALDADRAVVAGRAARSQAVRARVGDLQAWCARLADRLGTMGYEERREALYMLGVRVWPDDHPDQPRTWTAT